MGKSIDPMLVGNAGSDVRRQLPALIGVDESPAGYSLAGCSPAAPASASPAKTRMRYSGLAGRLIFSERRTWS
jgi:hypothetical protein